MEGKALKKSIKNAVELMSQNGYVSFENFLNILFLL